MGFPPLTTTAPQATLVPRQSWDYWDHEGTPPVGALTTVWSAEEGCFPVTTRSTSDLDTFWSDTPECAPPGYESYFETFYYSPAICPSGFTVGCSRYGFQGPDVEPTETAMLCVLSDYSCATDDWNYYATNTDLAYAQIMIEIRWAESDLSILETHPMTPGLILAGATGTTTRTRSGTSTRTSTSASFTPTGFSGYANERSGGLTTGAQAAIGVGLGLFAVLVIGIVAFFISRYRRNRENANKPATTQQPPMGQYPYPAQQYPQGYPQAGYTPYVDPKTGVVTYYSTVPGNTAVGASPTIARPQPTQTRDPVVSNKAPILPIINSSELSNNSPNNSNMNAVNPVPGNQGATTPIGGTENRQS